MSKRGDHIRKRKDGRWEGRYQQGRTASGAIKYRSVYGHSYGAVKEKLAAIAKTSEDAYAHKEFKSFGEILDLWMDSNKMRLKGGSINKYQNLIDAHIIDELGALPIDKVASAYCSARIPPLHSIFEVNR